MMRLPSRQAGLAHLAVLVTIVLFVVILGFLNKSQLKKSDFKLELESPIDSTVITSSKIAVKGKTLPNATVVVYTEEDANSAESDSKGQFESQIELSPGLNKLTVTAYNEKGEEKSIFLDVVYDSQVKGKKTQREEPTGQEKKEDHAPPGQEKKEEQSKAIIGNVQEVKPNSIVLEEKNSKQDVEVKVQQNTIITGQEGENFKLNNIKPKDEAAIIPEKSEREGGKPEKETPQTTTAAKIFVKQTSSPAQSKRHAIQGVITDITGKALTVTHQIHKDRTFKLLVDEQTEIKFKAERKTSADLRIGQRIAAVGDLNEEGILVAKLIHIIKETDTSEVQPTPTPTTTPTTPPETDLCTSETLDVPFKNGASGVTTQNSYQGCFNATVTGVGQASGTEWSDAFYVYTDSQGNPATPIHYALKYNWTLWINGSSAENSIQNNVVPSYNPSHNYTFAVCLAEPTKLTFSVGDTYVVDNTGSYTVQTCASP